MSDARVDPSGHHLKKDLTALRKARFLRDPETSSSWRCPLSSRSVAATYGWNYGDGMRGNSNGANGSFMSSELEYSLPSRSENNRKKVFLYNWRQQSGKSSDSEMKLDRDNREALVLGSANDNFSDTQKVNSKSETHLEDPITIFRGREGNLEAPTRRVDKKLKKSAISKRLLRNSIRSKQLDVQSSSLQTLSISQSDDTDYCNSEDLQLSVKTSSRKIGYTSHTASPLLSGYENWSHSSKMLKNTRREDSSYSYTPASTSSFNRCGDRYPSTVGSWDGTTASFDGDEVDQLDLPRGQGYGIPCYGSKRKKYRGFGGCYSPSLSETLRRKGSSIFCGGQTLYRKQRSSTSRKQNGFSKSSHSLPLLSNSCDGGGSSMDTASDELLTKFEELNLEASSRLDGRRWSSCRSQDGLELLLTAGADEAPDHRSLSQKYRPRIFNELIGQNIVVQSLTNAILKGRIAPVYLFHGPRGTGKTSMARIFAAALNCLSTEETKPCGLCQECTDFASGKSSNVEIDATSKKGIDKIRHLLKILVVALPQSRCNVFIINECHMLPSKAWSSFLKFLSEPLSHVVFIFVTTDPDNLPRTVISRSQKYLFPKIKDDDIVMRLMKLSAEENLDVETDALDLIALNSDGSLRDAEMMLDQLSLLGKRITTSLVNDLVGVVSDEKLLDLLELAMSSDTAETVKRARELMASGVDPMALMSQLAGLIMDIIAGTYRLVDIKCSSSSFGVRSLTEAELERLKQALKILSEAEKQLRYSSERSTWFTAALLQLGSGHSLDSTYSSSKSKKNHMIMKKDTLGTATKTSFHGNKTDGLCVPWKSTSPSMHSTVNGRRSSSMSAIEYFGSDALPTGSKFMETSALAATSKDTASSRMAFGCMSPEKLHEIWRMCIERCHSKTLKQLLRTYGKLVSISEIEGVLIAYIAFGDVDIKSRAERFLSSITNSMEIVLRRNVEVRIGLMPDGGKFINGMTPVKLAHSKTQKQMETVGVMESEGNINCNKSNGSDQVRRQEPLKLHRKIFNDSKGMLQNALADSCNGSHVPDERFEAVSLPVFSAEENVEACSTRPEIPMQWTRLVIDEERLESAWLQAAEKSMPGSVSQLKPERNQVLPQDGICCQNEMKSTMALVVSSKHSEDELNHEVKALKGSDSHGHQNQSNKRVNCYPLSPSLLHSNSLVANFNKENMEYESGPDCNGLICWKPIKPYKGKVKQGTPVRSHKRGGFLWFGQCAKSKTTEKRIKR